MARKTSEEKIEERRQKLRERAAKRRAEEEAKRQAEAGASPATAGSAEAEPAPAQRQELRPDPMPEVPQEQRPEPRQEVQPEQIPQTQPVPEQGPDTAPVQSQPGEAAPEPVQSSVPAAEPIPEPMPAPPDPAMVRQITSDSRNPKVTLKTPEAEAARAAMANKDQGTNPDPSQAPDAKSKPIELPEIKPMIAPYIDKAKVFFKERVVPKWSGDTEDFDDVYFRRKKKRPVDAASIAKMRRLRRSALVLAGVLLVVVIASVIAYNIWDVSSKETNFYLSDRGYNHAKKFNDYVVVNGIDVSEHQGTDIEWKRVKTSGADFVFVRAGYRSYDDGSLHEDAQFDSNVKGALKAGIATGVYFYSQALTPAEAEEEAAMVLEMVKPYGNDITMPIAIDYEIYPDGRLDQKIKTGEMYAAYFYHDIVQAFCRKIEAAGYESLVYANKNMLTNYMDASVLDDTETIWLARYEEKASLKAKYMFWQCSDSARVGGIEGVVDHDFWYVDPTKVYETRGQSDVGSDLRLSVSGCRVSFHKSSAKLKRLRATPEYSVSYEGKGMNEGRDYTASIIRNTTSGTGYIILKGIGKYKDWMAVPFTIED